MKDNLIFLKHILESIAKMESFTQGMTKNRFMQNEMAQSAVVRQIEIIGEAVKNLPIDFTNKYPHLPWSDIAGTRDKLIHHYFGVDLDLIWDDILKKNLPELKKQIKDILAKESQK